MVWYYIESLLSINEKRSWEVRKVNQILAVCWQQAERIIHVLMSVITSKK